MHWQSVGICQPLLLQTISGGAIPSSLSNYHPTQQFGKGRRSCGGIALESSLQNSFKTTTLFIL